MVHFALYEDVLQYKVKINQIISGLNNVNYEIYDETYKLNGIVCDKNTRSTKGKWHGYGLEITKDIIKKNKKIKNTTECISNVFIQNIVYKF